LKYVKKPITVTGRGKGKEDEQKRKEENLGKKRTRRKICREKEQIRKKGRNIERKKYCNVLMSSVSGM
jgi:hypothetical protein